MNAAHATATDHAARTAAGALHIGWARTDITPTRPVALGGMAFLRISTGVADPLSATALVLETPATTAGQEPEILILVSCDLRAMPQVTLDGVRSGLRAAHPQIDPMRVILNVTHTHSAPPLDPYGLPTDAMLEPEYLAFAVPRLVAVIAEAWANRQPGGISFGLSHAVIGHNRLITNQAGVSRIGGRVQDPDFSHIEGYEDHAVNLLYTWDAQARLTGVVVNTAVTAQTRQAESVISADYWHETRQELRRRLGEALFVLPQVSAAGDQMSRAWVHARAEDRMERLTGRTRRDQIAVRLADAVTGILPVMREHIDWAPGLQHQYAIVPLTRRKLGPEDVATAEAEGIALKALYAQKLEELAEDPTRMEDLDWVWHASRAGWLAGRADQVRDRYELQQRQPHFPVELHVIRLGEMAMVTNAFELYLDFGLQIKTRSPAVQTFVVQQANGANGYLPTARSVAGGAYGAVPASTNVGPEGGRELVEWTLGAIGAFWPGATIADFSMSKLESP